MNSVVLLKKKFASKVVLSCQAASCQVAEVARKGKGGALSYIEHWPAKSVRLHLLLGWELHTASGPARCLPSFVFNLLICLRL